MSKKIDFIDLRSIIEELADDSSWTWMALRKCDTSKKCHCAGDSQSFEKASPDCPRCFGSGYSFTDHLVKGYAWVRSPGVEFRTSVGTLSTETKSAILRWHREVTTSDYLLKLASDSSTGEIVRPFKIVGVFDIQDAIPLHAKEQRVEFWKLSVEERNLSMDMGQQAGTGRNKDFSAEHIDDS